MYTPVHFFLRHMSHEEPLSEDTLLSKNTVIGNKIKQ
jgi:hypothetical protein